MAELDSVEVQLAEAHAGADALLVELTVRNAGQHTMHLENPFELAQLLVVDHNGFPKRVPMTAPSLLINAKGRAAWKLETAVPIVEVKRNGEPTERDTLDSEVLELGAGESYAAAFLIERFLPDPDEVSPGIEPVHEQVEPGEYRVRALVTLINANNPKQSRTAQTQTVTFQLARA
jgi:hypothetical protein